MPYPFRPAPSPVSPLAALAGAALLAGALPGGRWSDALALLATVAGLAAAHDRRTRDMLIAGGLAVGLAPAGLLLAPLWVGLAIRRGAARHLPIAILAAASAAWALPWPTPHAGLPNLAGLADAVPSSVALVAAAGAGLAAWLGARAAILPPAALFAEARLGSLLLATVLPLPIGALVLVALMAALPLPVPPRRRAANDNVAHRPPIRLAA